MNNGFVYLVGAGPGDPGLITVKALEALEAADCIIYDYRANASLLGKYTCEKIYVGKQGGDQACGFVRAGICEECVAISG